MIDSFLDISTTQGNTILESVLKPSQIQNLIAILEIFRLHKGFSIQCLFLQGFQTN